MYTQYSVIGQVMNKGKRIGFVVRDNSTGAVKRLCLKDIMQLIRRNDTQINIKYTKRGFELTDGKRIKDLGVYKLKEDSKVVVGISAYTGYQLEQYTNNMLKNIKAERDFVSEIMHYTHNTYNRVLAISGLRGTGKTIGMLQAIKDIGKYDKIVYMSINDGNNIRCQEIWDIIEEQFNSIEYIFIDEITRAIGLYNTSAFLSDNLCGEGKKVVISGTDSLAIVKAEENSLYHRVIIKNVTFIKYAEALKTVGQSLKEYISMGGLYRAEAIKSISGLRRYIDTAVVDNIMNTLTKNGEITSLLGLDGIGKEKLRVIVFKILYAVVYTSTQQAKAINIKRLLNLFEYDKDSREPILDIVFDSIGINQKSSFNRMEVASVLESLEEIGILVKASNIVCNYSETGGYDEYKYYITNPSLTNRVLYSVVKVLENNTQAVKSGASIKGFSGYILESILICHIIEVCKRHGYEVMYYRDNKDREIDIIIKNENIDLLSDDASGYILYEVKYTDDPDIAVLKSLWINDSEVIHSVTGWTGELKENAILYMGESKGFSGFTSKGLISNGQLSISDIERKNMDIHLINIGEFLLNYEKRIDSLLGE